MNFAGAFSFKACKTSFMQIYRDSDIKSFCSTYPIGFRNMFRAVLSINPGVVSLFELYVDAKEETERLRLKLDILEFMLYYLIPEESD